MASPIYDVITVMADVKKFVEHDFTLGLKGDVSDMSPPHKHVLARWKRCYHSKMNGLGQIVSYLLPLLEKCEATEADSLMSS